MDGGDSVRESPEILDLAGLSVDAEAADAGYEAEIDAEPVDFGK